MVNHRSTVTDGPWTGEVSTSGDDLESLTNSFLDSYLDQRRKEIQAVAAKAVEEFFDEWLFAKTFVDTDTDGGVFKAIRQDVIEHESRIETQCSGVDFAHEEGSRQPITLIYGGAIHGGKARMLLEIERAYREAGVDIIVMDSMSQLAGNHSPDILLVDESEFPERGRLTGDELREIQRRISPAQEYENPKPDRKAWQSCYGPKPKRKIP